MGTREGKRERMVTDVMVAGTGTVDHDLFHPSQQVKEMRGTSCGVSTWSYGGHVCVLRQMVERWWRTELVVD